MAENGEVNVETPVRGQIIAKERGDYHLFLMEWEKTDDDMLLGRLKQIMAEYRADLGTGDFRAPLQAAIHDQAVKYQLLGYFEETAWTLENIENILNRNFTVNRKNIYRPDLLPTMAHPHKSLDETFNTKENFESYGIAEYRRDPPYYHFSVYAPTQITVSTDRGFISRVVGRLPTYGQADSRSKLARPPGSEVPPADPDGRLQTEEPRVHPQQARDQPCRRSLEVHAGRDLGRG